MPNGKVSYYADQAIQSLKVMSKIEGKFDAEKLVNDQSAKKVVRPNRTGSANLTEGSAEPFGRTLAIFGLFLGQMFGPKLTLY